MSEFKRVLSGFDATAIVVGVIIGSGIFLTTGIVAGNIPSPMWILIAWFVGGLLAATGALTFAQLAVLYPHTGGSYVYLRQAFGGLPSFLYGWTLFAVMQCGSIAALATGFAHFFGELVPMLSMEREIAAVEWGPLSWQLTAGKFSAVAAIVVFTLFNYRGARLGKNVQNALTIAKIVALVAFVAVALLGHDNDYSVLRRASPPTILGFALGLIPILWTYAGWYNINFTAEEVREPERNIPLALLGGVAIVTVLYVLVNVVYLVAIPLDELPKTKAVAHVAGARYFGDLGAYLVAATIAVFCLGAVNGLIFASPRAYYAMARDGVFANMQPTLHPKYQTPHKFLVVQGIWSSLLVFAGGYNALLTYVMFSGLLFTALAGSSIFVFRHRQPQQELWWQWSYPLVPIVFILSSLGLAAAIFEGYPLQSSVSLAIILASSPVYFYLGKGE